MSIGCSVVDMMFIKYDGTGNSCSIFHSHWMGCKSKHAVAYCIVINVLDVHEIV